MTETLQTARLLASKPIASLVETKRTIVAWRREAIAAARARENDAFVRLMGQPANLEALTALGEHRAPDFTSVDTAHPVDIGLHRAD
jgi:enoyl-CoA hydratase/carnithine racemase